MAETGRLEQAPHVLRRRQALRGIKAFLAGDNAAPVDEKQELTTA